MDIKVKQETLKRLAIAQGHLQKVKDMVEQEEYCPEIIHQSQAVQSSLKKVNQIILHGHLDCCVLSSITAPKAKKEQLANEIVDLFSKNGK